MFFRWHRFLNRDDQGILARCRREHDSIHCWVATRFGWVVCRRSPNCSASLPAPLFRNYSDKRRATTSSFTTERMSTARQPHRVVSYQSARSTHPPNGAQRVAFQMGAVSQDLAMVDSCRVRGAKQQMGRFGLSQGGAVRVALSQQFSGVAVPAICLLFPRLSWSCPGPCQRGPAEQAASPTQGHGAFASQEVSLPWFPQWIEHMRVHGALETKEEDWGGSLRCLKPSESMHPLGIHNLLTLSYDLTSQASTGIFQQVHF